MINYIFSGTGRTETVKPSQITYGFCLTLTDLKEFYKLGKKLTYIKIWNTINFFDLYAYSLKQTERIRKL